MSEMTGGDPIRAMADKLREDMEKFQGRTIVATRRRASRATMAAARRSGGKATAVARGR